MWRLRGQARIKAVEAKLAAAQVEACEATGARAEGSGYEGVVWLACAAALNNERFPPGVLLPPCSACQGPSRLHVPPAKAPLALCPWSLCLTTRNLFRIDRDGIFCVS
jgi:hypothetical protein